MTERGKRPHELGTMYSPPLTWDLPFREKIFYKVGGLGVCAYIQSNGIICFLRDIYGFFGYWGVSSFGALY